MTNVNTIIINNAQNFGLSQLHQLRGRVGRSNKQAYAALILCDQNNFTKDAEKRIDAFVKTKSLAGGIEYLLNEDNDWVTGTNLIIDGGYSAI